VQSYHFVVVACLTEWNETPEVK